MCTCTHAHMHALMHTQTHACSLTRMHTHTHTRSLAYTCDVLFDSCYELKLPGSATASLLLNGLHDACSVQAEQALTALCVFIVCTEDFDQAGTVLTELELSAQSYTATAFLMRSSSFSTFSNFFSRYDCSSRSFCSSHLSCEFPLASDQTWCICVYMCTCMYTHICMHTFMCVYVYICACMCRTHAHMHTCTHTRTHAHMHARTHEGTHA